jgi:hypothetical protein
MDFGGLAARMAGGLDGVRACLIVSRDGLSLGAHPAAEEHRAREAWDAVQSVGDVQRGFAEVGQELWAVARRGPYAAIMVASPEVRPGLLLDRMDTHLLAAERLRARSAEEGQEAQATRSEPARRPRTPLHPEPKPEPKVETRPKPDPVKPALEGLGGRLVDLSGVGTRETDNQIRSEEPSEPASETAAPAPTAAFPAGPAAIGPSARVALTASIPPVPAPPSVEAPAEAQSPDGLGPGGTPEGSEDPERPAPSSEAAAPEQAHQRDKRHVDRIALAREFSRLLSDEFGGGR